jgi:polar amino acid transport system substrate-binding protein
MLDFFMAFTKNHTDVKWQVIPDKIDVGWDAIGVQKGNYALRDCLNIALYKLHSSGFVDAEWQKAFGSEMLEKIPYQPYF